MIVPAAGSAAEQHAYAAAANYATPTITIGQGDTLTFTNLDSVAKHDLLDHDGHFGSDLLGNGESGPVRGVEKLSVGTYQFHCSLHSWMRGVLQVSPAGGGGSPSPPTVGGGGAGSPTATAAAAPNPYDVWLHAAQAPIGKASWPFYGKDLSNSRNGGEAGNPTPAQVSNLGVAWTFHSGWGDFLGTPAVAKGLVVAGTFGGHVVAVDAATGKQKWHHAVGQPINGSVAIAGKRAFVPIAQPHSPRLLALDLESGKKLWDVPVDTQKNSDVYGSPVVWNKTVYIGVSALFGELGDPEVSVRGNVVAVNAKNGKLRWRTFMVPPNHDGGAVWNTPAIDKRTGRLYVGTGNAYHAPSAPTTDSMVSLDARTGAMLGHYQATAGDVWNGTEGVANGPDHDFGASPNLFDGPGGRKLVGEGQKSGEYWALDRSSMQPAWSALMGPGSEVGGILGSTATDGKGIYGPDTVAGEEWALGTDGSRKWVTTSGGPVKFSATAVANGVVYSTDTNGFLNAHDANSGLPLAHIPLGAPSWSGVAVAGGTIFTATGSEGDSGYLVAYRVRKGDEETSASNHWDEDPQVQPDDWARDKRLKKQCKKKRYKRTKRCKQYRKRRAAEREEAEEQGEGHHAAGQGGAVLHASREKGDRYVPKPAGTKDKLNLYYGPYTIPPGWDANRVDLDLPMQEGFLEYVDPQMYRVADMTEPSHQEAHIHHAHWFGLDPGNKEDNYTSGTHEWVFGMGDEETRGDFRERSAANGSHGAVYGQYIPGGQQQDLIYMLHNKTNQPMEVWIVLHVQFEHGSKKELEAIRHRPYHDVSGKLFGKTYDVPRQASGDGKWEYAKDSGKVIEWTATTDGTIIGAGGHVHPGGKQVVFENYGSKESPCPNDGRGYGGTLLIKENEIDHNVPLSEDYQTEVTHPAWRAPVHKGDRLRISGTYENRDHAWYTVMTHEGMYIDKAEAPKGRCKPYMVGKAKKKWKDPTQGVPNRTWGSHTDDFCGPDFGGPPCEKAEAPPKESDFKPQTTVHIANFSYLPGDRSSSLGGGTYPTIAPGEQLTFVNDDQFANIRHSVTTCPWPCNGKYVANYPLADGRWDSGTLGYDVIDGGSPNPRASTPANLPQGVYTYFCRIHPWMRGAFRVGPR
ncbi:MAG TPA: PQQ-binding-like beta-propeller repeat protein [Thermoleophilaceae bacterium]